MAKEMTDDEDRLRRKSRRRLIGAVALTTVVVIVLPMVLDSDPRPTGQDIDLRIPDKDNAGKFAPKMDFPASAPAVTEPAASAVAAPVTAASPVAAMPVAAPAKPVAPAAQPKAHETKAAPAKPKAEAPHAKAPVHKPGFVVQAGAFAKADSAHQLQKKLSKHGVKTYTEKAGDKVRVRAGPYSTREAADKVRHKLEAQGLHPQVIPVD